MKSDPAPAMSAPRRLSFSQSLDAMSEVGKRVRRKGQRLPVSLLDSKMVAYDFAQRAGVAAPFMHQAGLPIDQIEFRPGTVVKPLYENSSRGVFMVRAADDIVSLSQNVRLGSAAEARSFAQRQLERGVVKVDRWLAEDLLEENGTLARDVKFYMFYGEVGLVLETRRVPSVSRCWYDAAGTPVRTGKYANLLFDGVADHAAAQDVAIRISRELPGPFARVDLLISGGTVYFGEVTPFPSNYKGFNETWDARLGLAFTMASVRLAHDVAYGRSFEVFAGTEKREDRIIEAINAPVPELLAG